MTLNDYQKRVEDTWIENENDFLRIICGLGEELGEVLGVVKKFHRGDYSKEIATEKLQGEIGDLSYYIAKLCNDAGLDWEKILKKNLFKLNLRKENNTLKGDGSER